MSAKPAPARLGMGLASLIRTPDPAEPGAQGPRGIAVELLEPSPYQPRGPVSPESLHELAASIRANGVLQPLLVRPKDGGGYWIVAGERRWRAAQAVGLHEVPALVRPLSDREAMAAGLVENLQRTDLNAIEEAEGYQRLLDEFRMTHETLSASVGKSRSHIGNTIRLLRLPAPVQREVRAGNLSAGHARALLLHPDPVKAALTVISQGLSVRQTEALGAGKPAPEQGPDRRADQTPELLELEHRLSAHLGLRVKLDWNGRRGRIAIEVETLDQFEGVLALLKPPG
jgi:ParB family chromosome partitioning protein